MSVVLVVKEIESVVVYYSSGLVARRMGPC